MFKPHQKVYAASFLTDFGAVIGATAMPFYVFHHLGGGAETSGLIASVQAICYAAACLVSSFFVARARNGIVLSLIGGGIFVALYPLGCLFSRPVAFGFFLVVSWMGLSLYWPPLQAWLGGEPDPHLRRRYIAGFNVAWTMGVLLGPLVAGRLYPVNPRLPFFAVSVCGLAALVFVAGLRRVRREPAAAGTPEAEIEARPDDTAEALLHATWTANALMGVMIGASLSVFPKRIDELVEAGQLAFAGEFLRDAGFLSHPTTVFSFLFSSMALSRTCMFWLMGMTHRWYGRFGYLYVLQFSASCGLWMLSWTENMALMLVSFLMLGVGGGTAYFSSMYYSTSSPLGKHRRAAIHEGSIGLGSSLGSLTFGLAAGAWGTAFPFALTPLLVAAVLVLEWRLLARGRRRVFAREPSTEDGA